MRDPDVIVIGAGIGGLVSAGLLSARGMDVLLLEKESGPGGYVTGFWRKGFYFDATGAFVAMCKPGGELYRILESLAIADNLTFLPISSVWNIFYDFDIRLEYQNPAAYLEAVKNRFPEQSKRLQSYRRLTERVGKEFLDFEKAPRWKRLFMPLSFPSLFHYARKSHGQVLHKFFGENPQIASALSALPTALAPSSLSYIFVAVLWAKVLNSGVFYPKGGMKALSSALAQSISDHGGRIDFNTEVTGIKIRDGKVTGVSLSGGRHIKSKWVIGDINPFSGETMLPEGQELYGRMHRLKRFTPSLSALLFYATLPSHTLPADWPYFISIHTTTDLERIIAALEEGSMEDGLHLVITTPTVLDSSLAPEAHHSLKVLVHSPRAEAFERHYGSKEALDRLQHRVFSIINQFTGIDLENKALFIERATPMTLLRRTGNKGGAMYGLDAACNQMGPLRPPNRTALDNLLWVGHYTHPAHGIAGSAMSGRIAADIVLPPSGK